jgi:NADPH:quinone reductase-like Zn-dependent oxidoreductase
MDFEVKRSDVHETRVVDEDQPEVGPGQVLLRVDAFALTANNVTYAVLGDALRYWDFFPASDRSTWGRIPVWGFADVIATSLDELPEGTRVYGYLPMSTHLLVTPGRVSPRAFVDEAPHRASLPAAYNGYQRLDADPTHDPAHEDHRMLLWPLFFTSFLIDDFLDDNEFFGAQAVVVSSASSKTAIGTAFLLDARAAIEVIGLTSPRNVGFVEGLGVYDRVVPYDEVGALGGSSAAYVDIAGDAEVRSSVHRTYGDRLAHSMMVGATHWDQPAAAPPDLPGPAPSFFFAPDQIMKRTKEWGRAALDDRVAEAWRRYVEFAAGWLRIHHGAGPDAVQSAYGELVTGRTDPAVGHVLSMWPERADW